MAIPKGEVVNFLVLEELRNGKVPSQRSLCARINKRLRSAGKEFRVSEKRVRKLSMEIPEVAVTIKTRKGTPPKRCPACSRPLKRSYSRNLRGRKFLTRLKCTRCPYRGTETGWIPARYEFSLVKV